MLLVSRLTHNIGHLVCLNNDATMSVTQAAQQLPMQSGYCFADVTVGIDTWNP
jgi:hypothetical protein